MNWNDLGHYKPILSALVLPPVPFLLLILVGARLILPRRGWGWSLVLLGVTGVWLSMCQGAAVWVQDQVLQPPPPLPVSQWAVARQAGSAGGRHGMSSGRSRSDGAAIMVLGGGRESFAPEYGLSDLSHFSAERLRYGVWLARRTGLPLGFSGGVGWAQRQEAGPAEADIAARVAHDVYGVSLRWVENQSADTRQNAALTVAMLAQDRVSELILVTDAFHMPRALRVFREAAERFADQSPAGERRLLRITPAPIGFWRTEERTILAWLPSMSGAACMRLALHEWLAQWVRV